MLCGILYKTILCYTQYTREEAEARSLRLLASIGVPLPPGAALLPPLLLAPTRISLGVLPPVSTLAQWAAFARWGDAAAAALRGSAGFAAASLRARCTSRCRRGPLRCEGGKSEPPLSPSEVGLSFFFHASETCAAAHHLYHLCVGQVM